MYMSYCRFEGTHAELNTCLDVAKQHRTGDAEYPMSENEVNNFQQMVVDFVDWLHDMELLDDEGCLNMDTLNEVCDDMMKPNRYWDE